jgi:hypothetical protein
VGEGKKKKAARMDVRRGSETDPPHCGGHVPVHRKAGKARSAAPVIDNYIKQH